MTREDFQQLVSGRLRKLYKEDIRLRRIAQLSKVLEVNQSNMSILLNGRGLPSAWTLHKMRRAGVDLNKLLG